MRTECGPGARAPFAGHGGRGGPPPGIRGGGHRCRTATAFVPWGGRRLLFPCRRRPTGCVAAALHGQRLRLRLLLATHARRAAGRSTALVRPEGAQAPPAAQTIGWNVGAQTIGDVRAACGRLLIAPHLASANEPWFVRLDGDGEPQHGSGVIGSRLHPKPDRGPGLVCRSHSYAWSLTRCGMGAG